jgi:hypothetical protein
MMLLGANQWSWIPLPGRAGPDTSSWPPLRPEAARMQESLPRRARCVRVVIHSTQSLRKNIRQFKKKHNSELS